jgi:hypothetical protein
MRGHPDCNACRGSGRIWTTDFDGGREDEPCDCTLTEEQRAADAAWTAAFVAKHAPRHSVAMRAARRVSL